jgi:hypothetical protein
MHSGHLGKSASPTAAPMETAKRRACLNGAEMSGAWSVFIPETYVLGRTPRE